METLNTVLDRAFNVSLTETFQAKATYNAPMDCVEYVNSDEFALAIRVDGFLTLYKDKTRQRVIGFKCKGFRYIFEQIREHHPEIAECHFIPMIQIIEAALSYAGDELFEGKREAYEQAREIANRENVTIERPELKAA